MPKLLSSKPSQHFGKKSAIKAVDISFDITEGGPRLGWESGCGKSTTGRSIIGLYDITDGKSSSTASNFGLSLRLNAKPLPAMCK